MALTRPRPLFVPSRSGPVVDLAPSTPVLTVTLPTTPAPRLRGTDRRRLARSVARAERLVPDTGLPPAAQEDLVRRLRERADWAARQPAEEGLALVAGAADARHLTLRHPVVDRATAGPCPTFEDLVEASWGVGRLAVLHLVGRRASLLCADGADRWEPRPPWDPLGLQAHTGADRAAQLVRTALPAGFPLVAVGEPEVADEVRARHGVPVVAVVPGDHLATPASVLVVRAEHALRGVLDPVQREAMTGLALAVAADVAVRGPAAVAAGTPGPRDTLLVEERHLHGAVAHEAARTEAAGGAVVGVPDGFLARHGGVALVPAPDRHPAGCDHAVVGTPRLQAVP